MEPVKYQYKLSNTTITTESNQLPTLAVFCITVIQEWKMK